MLRKTVMDAVSIIYSSFLVPDLESITYRYEGESLKNRETREGPNDPPNSAKQKQKQTTAPHKSKKKLLSQLVKVKLTLFCNKEHCIF